MLNFRSNKNLTKLDKEYLNDLLCKFGSFYLQHSKTFDIFHAFLRVTIAELSTLKQVRFLAHPVYTAEYIKNEFINNTKHIISMLKFET